MTHILSMETGKHSWIDGTTGNMIRINRWPSILAE
jgi:hypothetical protein